MKANIIKLKNTIKELVKIQIETKEQRKAVKFKGVRTMSAGEATGIVQVNRDVLRHHYKAYAILRGKDPKSHALTKREEPYHEQSSVNSLLKIFEYEV